MRFYHSIRWRLQLWMGILLATLLAGFGFVVYQLEENQQFERVDAVLDKRIAVLRERIMRPPDGRRPLGPPPRSSKSAQSLPESNAVPRRSRRAIELDAEAASYFTRENATYGSVWSWSGAIIYTSDHARNDLVVPEDPGDLVRHNRSVGNFREAYVFTSTGDCILAGQSTETVQDGLFKFALGLLGSGLAVLLLGLAGGWWLTSRTIRPIAAINQAAREISNGDLNQRIPLGKRADELHQLGEVLNDSFEKLDRSFARQRQFTADASHELRTPLAVMISEAQTSLARDRSEEDYKETIEVCLENAQHMRALTESLLDLARFDENKLLRTKEDVDLAELAKEYCERLRPLADANQLTLTYTGEPATCKGDPTRIRQVITNLISNACRYCKPNGTITVVTKTDPETGHVLLEVQDTGQGIAEEDLPHIFERFYRADQSRSQPSGRTGLGLAICQAIAEAHGGMIQAQSRLGEGSTFTVRLRS